jgi:hypothetical protein
LHRGLCCFAKPLWPGIVVLSHAWPTSFDLYNLSGRGWSQSLKVPWVFIFSISSAVFSISDVYFLYGYIIFYKCSERAGNASRKFLSRPATCVHQKWGWGSHGMVDHAPCGSHGMAEHCRLLTRYHARAVHFIFKLKNNMLGL